MSKGQHASDCATHNAPAYPNDECDCGADDRPRVSGKTTVADDDEMDSGAALAAIRAGSMLPERSRSLLQLAEHAEAAAFSRLQVAMVELEGARERLRMVRAHVPAVSREDH